MPDAVLIVLLVFILYFPVCLLIAFIRALFSKKHHRKENFKNYILDILFRNLKSPQLVLIFCEVS